MKLILKNVKIYGFDPESYRTFDNDGKTVKQYQVPLYISEADKNLIDGYIFGKTSKNDKDEFVFYGKAKTPIPFFDADGKKKNEVVNEVFIADVSILIDEFQERNEDNSLKFNEDGTPSLVRYSKCLGIRYISKVENEAPKMPQKTYDTYADIFGGEDSIEATSSNKPTPQPVFNDLPDEIKGNDVEKQDLPF